MIDVSQNSTMKLCLCALFLMSAAKKVDKKFSCQLSSAHTVSEARNKDIDKMANLPLEKSVTSVMTSRTSQPSRTLQKGIEKAVQHWVDA